jgi:hypothetical protein
VGGEPFGSPPPGAGELHTDGGTLGPGPSTSEAGTVTSDGSVRAVAK